MPPSGVSTNSPSEKSSIHTENAKKTQHGPSNTTSDLDAHILNVNELGVEGQGLQVAHDGKTVLIPQPSSDPNDPLNWSRLKKHVTLLVITVVAFLPDFGSSIGIVALLPQAVYVALERTIGKGLLMKNSQWGKSQNTIQHNLVGNLFCLGAGGLFTVLLSAYFGRLPVLFFFTSMALGTSAWCAAATSFSSYMAARILNGFFSGVAQAVSILWKPPWRNHALTGSYNIGWLDVHPRHVLLPRAPVSYTLNADSDSVVGEMLISSKTQDQHLVQWHNSVALSWPSDHSIYNQ